MNCMRVSRRLSAYLDEQISDRERISIGLHLLRCHECRQRFEELRRMRLSLLADPRQQVPDDFKTAWRARVQLEKPGSEHKRRFHLPVLNAAIPAAACLILMATGLVLLYPREHSVLPQQGHDSGYRALDNLQTAPDAAVGGTPLKESASKASVPDENDTYAALSDAGNSFEGDIPLVTDTEPSEQNAASAAPRQTASESMTGAVYNGIWQVWLTSLGQEPGEVRRVMSETGLSADKDDEALLPLPMLLCREQTSLGAREVSQRLEDAGCRTVIEFVPE